MIKNLLLTIAAAVPTFLQAQTHNLYYRYNFETKVIAGGDTLVNPWGGGLNQPQFNMTDLNGDGRKDLVLFDRSSSKTLTYIAYLNSNNEIKYTYDPQYERLFPKSDDVLILRDFDKDGQEDCIFRDPYDSYLKLSKNNNFNFNLTNDFLKAYNFGNPPFDSSNFVLWAGNFPSWDDIDGDGDLDFLSTDYCGSDLIYYLNNQLENSLDKSAVSFEIPDRCFGGLSENAGGLILGGKCWYNKYYRYKKKHCASKTLTVYDVDNDGDKDLFLGNSEDLRNSLLLVINGKSELAMKRDTFIRIDTAYFSNDVKPLIPLAPAAFFLDIDQDGITDLVVAANENRKFDYPVWETNQVLFFKNTGSNELPKFEYVTNNLIVGDMIDIGAFSQPVLYDLDKDGDKDLLVSSNGDHHLTADKNDRIFFYENVGNAKYPVFKLITKDLWDISKDSISGLSISFGDLNGDGNDEMIAGTTAGYFSLYENSGTQTNPYFRRISSQAFGLYASTNTTPQLIDLNRDGKTDIVTGVAEGTFYYYKNTGTGTQPAFTLQTDSLGKIITNEFINSIPPRYASVGYSYPLITDLDHDGKYDMLAGTLDGYFRIYRNIEKDLTGTFELYDSTIWINNSFNNIDLGGRIKVAAGDLNGDTIPEIIAGNARGGLHYFRGVYIKDTSDVSVPSFEKNYIKIYPNPSDGNFRIDGLPAGESTISVVNYQGIKIDEFKSSDNYSISVNARYNAGIYVVFIENNGHMTAGKLVILH